MSVADALRHLEHQSGNRVRDQRSLAGQGRLNLSLADVSFCQAIDEISRLIPARVILTRDGATFALVDGIPVDTPVSYRDGFRVRVLRLSAGRDFEARRCSTSLHLDFSWDPSFAPLFVETGQPALVITDAAGTEVPLEVVGSGYSAVAGRTSLGIECRLPAFPRSATVIRSVRGRFRALVPRSKLSIRFDRISPAAGTDFASDQDEVTVRLLDFRRDEDLLSASVRLTYPAGGPKLESFQSWLGTARVRLVRRADGRECAPNGGREVKEQGDRTVIIRAYFSERQPQSEDEWDLTVEAPGPLVEREVSFEFRGLPLP